MPSERKANKIIFGNDTLIDLTSDTVTPNKLASGYTAHDASGRQITGTASFGGASVNGTTLVMSSASVSGTTLNA